MLFILLSSVCDMRCSLESGTKSPMLDKLMILEATGFQIHETQCTQGCY